MSTQRTLHINPLSKLVGAPAAEWERALRQLQEDEKHLYRYYQPMREAVTALTCGSIERDQVVSKMLASCDTVAHTPRQDVRADNLRAFVSFETHFMNRIVSFKASLRRMPQGEGVAFEGLGLLGSPHMIVEDHKGRTRYVYLHPSKWKREQLCAFLELLTIVLEERFGAQAKDIWCMNLKDGVDISWPRSMVSIRRKCRSAVRLYLRLTEHPPFSTEREERRANA